MSDHTTLTDTERATLAAWWESDWPSDGADVLDTLAATVESIVAARVAAARAERDRAWIGAVTSLLRAVTTNDATFDAVLPDMLAAARADERKEWLSRVGPLRAKHLRNVRLNINGRADIYDGFLADLDGLTQGADHG